MKSIPIEKLWYRTCLELLFFRVRHASSELFLWISVVMNRAISDYVYPMI